MGKMAAMYDKYMYQNNC